MKSPKLNWDRFASDFRKSGSVLADFKPRFALVVFANLL